MVKEYANRAALVLILLLLTVSGAFCQATITGTITDLNKNPYANGTASAIKVVPSGQDAGRPTIVPTNSVGFFTMTIPSGQSYVFTLCSTPVNIGPTTNPTPQQVCFSNTIPISITISQDISTLLNPIAAQLGPSSPSNVTGLAAGAPPQTQVNDPGNPGHFGGTPCENFPSLTVGPINADCDWHSKGPNPGFDITRYGARAFVPPAQTTTATCTSGLTSITLASAIDFINGDGITLTECGAATALSTPAAPSSVTPRGILNGASTVSYKIRAEDYANGRTAPSLATTITTANGTFGSIVRTITTASLVNGVITVTTSANHNFQVGEKVQIKGTGTVMDTVWRVNTITSATVFTIQTQFVRSPGQNVTVSTGTAESPSHIWVNWAAATNVLRYLIYRQDGGAGNYNLVGVAQGREPFYDDYGFGVNATDIGPNVPATDSVGAQNQTLATTISSGAGTVSVVVANAASNSKSGSSVSHDNTVAWLAAANAALNTQGGEVLVPNAGSGQFYLTFPLQLPAVSSGGLTFKINGSVAAQQPFMPNSFQNFYGTAGNQSGRPSFQTSYYGGLITGKGNPLVFLPGTNSVSFDHIFISGDSNSKQQWLFLGDNGPSGTTGVTNTQITNSYVNASNAPAGSAAVVFRGTGFGEILTNDVLSNGGGGTITYLQQGALRLTGSTISTPQASPGIGSVRDSTFLGGGVRVDGDSFNALGLVIGGNWLFNNIFSESLCNPSFDFQNISSNNAGSWFINNIDAADAACGGTIPTIELSGIAGTFKGLTVVNAGSINAGTGGATPAGASFTGFTSGSDDNLPAGSIITRSGNYNLGAGNSGSRGASAQALELVGAGIRMISPGKVFAEGDPPTGLSCTVQAGGSIPVGTQPITVTAGDVDFGESVQSVPFSVTTTPGNQTVNCSWTAPSPAPVGYYLYINGARANGGFIIGTSTVQSIIGGASNPLQSGGGPTGISRTSGLWTNQFQITGTTGFFNKQTATFTANRNVTWPDASGTVQLAGTLNSTYDNFNRANGGLGSNWTTPTGENALAISSNTVVGGTAAVVNHQYWNATLYANDEFAQFTVVTLPTGGDQFGVSTRVSTSARTYYIYRCTATSRDLVRANAGVYNTISTVASPCVVGDILRLEVTGNTQTGRRNGTVDLTGADTSIPAGANVGLFTVGNTGAGDNWSGGNFHPTAQLDTEQDWTQPQHFTQPVTIGPTNPIAGALTSGALYTQTVVTNGGVPTCAATGTGTGATCGTLQTNSDDESGAFTISTGTTPAATGTITLTFNNSTGGFKYCIFEPANTGLANWNARASFIITAVGGSNNQAAWDNNAVSLTGSTTYVVQYVCGRH